MVVGSDAIQQKQTDFSRHGHQGDRLGAHRAVFFGGYYAEAALLVKQLRDGRLHRHLRRR